MKSIVGIVFVVVVARMYDLDRVIPQLIDSANAIKQILELAVIASGG
jgi:hypothetical protein